ncbi:Uncharacterised protein [Candidatus Norongarragalina meridionalis]|nr:Uncharacterised protein [Candidatus Norongarragalina meridionalis]
MKTQLDHFKFSAANAPTSARTMGFLEEEPGMHKLF